MRRLHRAWLRAALIALTLLATVAPAHANTPLALWKSFDGNINFTGTQASLRTGSNDSGSPCAVLAPSTVRSANLVLPANAVVVSAQLYWAGSGTPDSTVTFQNTEITASRRFTSATIGNGFDYFGAAADVTSLVQTGGTYTFSGLTVANGAPWCGSQGVLGGFSLLVVYKLSTEPLRVLNIYEGLQYLRNTQLTVTANNFRWDSSWLPTNDKARAAHIVWEGDPALQSGESVTLDDNVLSNDNNPAGNQFNSFSNVNNDKASYGIDFDVYDTVVRTSSSTPVVTSGFASGADMVLVGTSVLLLPTMKVSDLAIKISRAGALKINTDVEYTVTVTNNGPVTETGAITVTNTLPPGMYYVSGVVTGWSCTATQVAGTCVYRGTLAPGASAPVLTVKARVSTLGDKTNTVVVKGTTTDDNQANNSASDSGVATNADGSTGTVPATPPSYIFTDSACKADIAIGAAGQTCKVYTAATTGGKPASVWLTATNNKGVPTAASGKDETTGSFQFMLECNNPAAGTVSASYAGAAIPVCAPQGTLATWSDPLKIKFPAKTVSVEQSLVYNDVGKIRLNLKENNVTASTEVFVSAPLRIDFKRIANGIYANPGNIATGGAGFAQAGAPLALEIGAVLANNAGFAPNFGNERLTPLIVLGQSAAVSNLASQGEVVENAARRKWAGGILATEASWSEVGAVNFTVRADDPEMTGDASNRYLGVKIAAGTAAVGRFYPAYFTTDATGPFNCPKNLPSTIACPRAIDGQINGAVYSQQPFNVTVDAYNFLGAKLRNFPGAWFNPITLSAVASAGKAELLAINLTPPTGATRTTIETAAQLPKATSYKLASGYDDANPRAAVSAPTVIFVRAEAAETTLAGDVVITSRRVGEVSDEGDILVLNGRMKLANALGSDLLRTPLGLRAEYWAGPTAGWLLNARYEDSRAIAGTDLAFRECKFDFAGTGTRGCNDAILGLASTPGTLAIAKGQGVLWLKAPGKKLQGAARRGGFGVRYPGSSASGAPWLPGTTGRVSFGSHRSPVIYVREMYY